MTSQVFDVFLECFDAIRRGELIKRPSVRDKEFHFVVGYRFDLRTNDLSTETIPNPGAGTKHKFVAYRPKTEPGPMVTLANG